MLDGPGIESLWVRSFPHSSRPSLKSTQPRMKLVPGFFSGGKANSGWRQLPTPSNAELKGRVDLYLYSLSLSLSRDLLWSVLGQIISSFNLEIQDAQGNFLIDVSIYKSKYISYFIIRKFVAVTRRNKDSVSVTLRTSSEMHASQLPTLGSLFSTFCGFAIYAFRHVSVKRRN
jgi:hypothetical protein